jgi:hypothetical protein
MPRAAPVINTVRFWKRELVELVDSTDAIDGEIFDDKFVF